MTKQWKPGRETVALRPSRIRREPVRLDTPKTVVVTRRLSERDIWMAMLGVALFAISTATIVIGVSMATNKMRSATPVSAPQLKFDYCGGTRQADCVVNGDTFYLGAERISIAGIDAPDSRAPACRREAQLGVDSAVRLRRLLNEGIVTLEGGVLRRDVDGAKVSKVAVNGVDVARVMIGSGLARDLAGGERSWC